MENIHVLCEKMINDNISGDIDPYVKELLTIAVMAIVIDNGEYALKIQLDLNYVKQIKGKNNTNKQSQPNQIK